MRWLLRELLEFYVRKRHHTTKEELYIWLYHRARLRGGEPPKIETVLRYLRRARRRGLIGVTIGGRIYIHAAKIQAYLNGSRTVRSLYKDNTP